MCARALVQVKRQPAESQPFPPIRWVLRRESVQAGLRNKWFAYFQTQGEWGVDVAWGGFFHKEESFRSRSVGRAGEDGLPQLSTSCLSPQALGQLTVPFSGTNNGNSSVCTNGFLKLPFYSETLKAHQQCREQNVPGHERKAPFPESSCTAEHRRVLPWSRTPRVSPGRMQTGHSLS